MRNLKRNWSLNLTHLSPLSAFIPLSITYHLPTSCTSICTHRHRSRCYFCHCIIVSLIIIIVFIIIIIIISISIIIIIVIIIIINIIITIRTTNNTITYTNIIIIYIIYIIYITSLSSHLHFWPTSFSLLPIFRVQSSSFRTDVANFNERWTTYFTFDANCV